MAKKGGLGRVMDALFLDNSAEENGNAGAVLNINEIEPNRNQPRKNFSENGLEELAKSIEQNGIIQPILVRPMSDGSYQLIAGERRWRAARMAGLHEVPVTIREMSDEEASVFALIENLQREDLSPVEEAEGLKSLIESYGFTQEEAADRVGKSRSAIANTTRLLDLPNEILELVCARELSAGHARTLLGLKSREDMLPLAKRVVELDLSVRALEDEVKRANKAPKKFVEIDDSELPVVDYFRELEVRVQSELGRKVKIEGKGRKKAITLYYEDNEDLDEILELLCGKDFLEQI